MRTLRQKLPWAHGPSVLELDSKSPSALCLQERRTQEEAEEAFASDSAIDKGKLQWGGGAHS